jgi:hypothetical protein
LILYNSIFNIRNKRLRHGFDETEEKVVKNGPFVHNIDNDTVYNSASAFNIKNRRLRHGFDETEAKVVKNGPFRDHKSYFLLLVKLEMRLAFSQLFTIFCLFRFSNIFTQEIL